MRFYKTLFYLVACSVMLIACSGNDINAGIEIGNPELEKTQALALRADFSIDYVEVNRDAKLKPSSLARASSIAKDAAADEPVLIDTLNLILTEVRSFCSFYVGVSVSPVQGLIVWPYEDNPAAVLPVSFVNGRLIEKTFSNIDLQSDGRLKELGVYFQVGGNKNYAMYGRALVGGKYVPFIYELSEFQIFSLRYHFSQIEVSDRIASLSVKFRVRHFVKGIDFSKLNIDEDGIIRIARDSNVSTWNEMNKQFLPSFQAMRYEYTDARGFDNSGYVNDILFKVAKDTAKNIVTNAKFNEQTNDWILLNQLRGESDSTYILNKDSSRTIMVNVTSGGQYSYSVQLMHENIPLIASHKYKCSFVIKSNENGEITARIGSYLTYETIGFQEHLKVGTFERTVEIEFTPEVSDPFARLEFNLGSRVRKFWIRNVKIVRLD